MVYKGLENHVCNFSLLCGTSFVYVEQYEDYFLYSGISYFFIQEEEEEQKACSIYITVCVKIALIFTLSHDKNS